ncbi:MAG: L,D-transpeptidase family protein, partial [Bacteroidia bacterium]|nr:L,D-transpeptidase family protein [Bacteroidia bacterium]
EIDILLSNALIDYSNHIRYGFFNPLEKYDKCYFLPLVKKDSTSFERLLNSDSTLKYLNDIQFKNIEYQKLQTHYLKLMNLKWDSIPPADTPKISIGDSNIVLRYIANRLIVTGELDISFNKNNFNIYDTILKKAVVRFQAEHGLLADGVIGKNTIAQMNISAKDRTIQVAVNLERLRWNSYNFPNKYLKINIPEFMLYAYNADTFKLALKVCCGEKKPSNYNERLKKYLKTHKIQDRPPNHETPIFQSKINHLVLNPDWLVPLNIVQKELYYNFIKDPLYLRDHEYKVYLNNVEVNPDSINWKKYDPNHIPFRLKQNPGEINALGKIKFVFPNPYDVFLHDTPTKNAFDRAYRAVSHGCIRVEDPLKLVKLLLDDKKWEIDDIRMAIGLEPEDKKDKKKFKKRMEDFKKWKELAEKDSVKLETKSIFFKKQIPITINYYTAFVDTNGYLQFRDDLYKRDIPIIEKLK